MLAVGLCDDPNLFARLQLVGRYDAGAVNQRLHVRVRVIFGNYAPVPMFVPIEELGRILTGLFDCRQCSRGGTGTTHREQNGRRFGLIRYHYHFRLPSFWGHQTNSDDQVFPSARTTPAAARAPTDSVPALPETVWFDLT